MPTSCESPDGRQPTAADVAAPVASSVAQDLEAIFPHEPPPTETRTRLRLRRRGRRAGPAPTGEGRAAAVGALLAAAFVGVSAGALVGRATGPTHSTAPAAVSPPASTLPNPGPLPVGPLHAAAPVLAASAPTVPASAVPASAVPASAVPASAGLQRTTLRHPAAARRNKAHGGCRGSHCRGSSVMAADARLRRAYASAVDAGVSRSVLVDYRERWSRLRRQAPRRPSLVAARYDEMASELNKMAAGRHRSSRHVASRNPRPFRSLRTELAALWR